MTFNKIIDSQTLRSLAGIISASLVLLTPTLVHADQIYQVRLESGQQSITIGGTVVARHEVTLSAQVPGRISMIAGKEGDQFSKGDLLIQIDDAQLRAKLKEASAAFQSAQSRAQNAQIQYSRELISPKSDRTSSMPGMGMPGMFDQVFSRPMSSMMGMESPGIQRDADLHQQGSQVSQAHSGVSQAEAKIAQINANIRDSRSIAPFGGTITQKLIQSGDTVQPGQAMIVFANLEQLQIKANIPSRLVHNLKAGQVIQARLDVSPDPIDVRVAQIFPAANENQHTITVKFDLLSSSPASPGMYADILVPDSGNLNGSQKLMLPRAALTWRGSMPGVKVIDGKGEAHLRLLRIKSGTQGPWVQVYAGLKEGERVLVPGVK